MAADEINVIIKDEPKTFDQMPVIIEGRTLVPMRGVFESLGDAIYWDDATKTVAAKKSGKTISLVIGEKTAIVDGDFKTLDVAPEIINGRTMVPVRFVFESLGEEYVKEIYDRAREADPDGVLYYNETAVYNDDFKEKINQLIEMGADIDAIGIQSHMDNADYSMADLKAIYDFLAEKGFRLKVTEFSCGNFADELLRASYMRDFMINVLATRLWMVCISGALKMAKHMQPGHSSSTKTETENSVLTSGKTLSITNGGPVMQKEQQT